MRRVAVILISALASAGASGADFVALSGRDLYQRFCSSCHGEGGHGDGPVSTSLAVEVPDLTLIARRHGDRFPRARIAQIIDGRAMLGAHGSRTMPVWGEDLGRAALGDPDAEKGTETIITRLTDYLWSLQRSAPR